MSMMICRECDRLLDTDFDLEGTWTDQHEWICTACTERLAEMMNLPQERDDAAQ